MIYTITLNPSLDYIVSVDSLSLGTINRTCQELINPGGKGINVSLVLSNLGIESTAMGFCAGFTGDEIISLLKRQNIKSDFIYAHSGLSRINVKIKSDNETEINGSGPVITKDNLDTLFDKLSLLNDNDILVLAGSIPSSVPKNIYGDILSLIADKKVLSVVDTTKDALLDTLKYHPFLIKPNHHELGEIFNSSINSFEDALFFGRKLIDMGAENVLISMAEYGAIFIGSDGKIYKMAPPVGTLINSVGAGDSMVAGFLAGYQMHNDYEKAFYLGLCAGSASAFSQNMATKEEIRKLLSSFSKEGIL